MPRAFRLLVLGFALVGLVGDATRAQDKKTPADAWVAAYQKLGGKAGLTTATGEEPSLWVEKRLGQAPLIGLDRLKPESTIRTIGLQGYEVDDADLEALGAWKQLTRIEVIDGKKVTGKGVKAIARLPKLREVVLADSAVTTDGVTAFSGHPGLTHLTLSNTVLESRLRKLDLENLPRLATVTLAGEGMTAVRIANMPRLRLIGDFPTTLETADFSDLGALTALDFRGTKLKKLSLSGTPKLESVDLRETQLDEKAVADLRRAFPGVSIQR
jgi:hypothetical protein